MKLEKFSATSMTELIELIQRKLGPDAIIYSHTKTERGVEAIAGITKLEPKIKASKASKAKRNKETVPKQSKDVKELIQQFASQDLIFELKSLEKYQLLVNKLRKLGFTYEFSESFAHQYASAASKESIANNEFIVKLLLSSIRTEESEQINSQKICTLIGPTGIGKSTTIAKLARRFTAIHSPQQLGIISTDFQRIITKNQFHYFGKLLDIEIEYARNLNELLRSIDYLSDKKLILIDTAGVNQKDNQKLAELFERFSSKIQGLSSYLVLPCNVQSEILDDVAQKFLMPHTKGCILTKIDESNSIAPCLSVVIKHDISIAYCCNGQNIIKDIYVPTRAQLINDLFNGVKSAKPVNV